MTKKYLAEILRGVESYDELHDIVIYYVEKLGYVDGRKASNLQDTVSSLKKFNRDLRQENDELTQSWLSESKRCQELKKILDNELNSVLDSLRMTKNLETLQIQINELKAGYDEKLKGVKVE